MILAEATRQHASRHRRMPRPEAFPLPRTDDMRLWVLWVDLSSATYHVFRTATLLTAYYVLLRLTRPPDDRPLWFDLSPDRLGPIQRCRLRPSERQEQDWWSWEGPWLLRREQRR